jgi:predicted TIM-barrel fold metal-dependent hydrolase
MSGGGGAKVMIIDFHVHVFEDRSKIEDLIRTMDENGVDMSVMLPVIPHWQGGGTTSTEFLCSLVQRYPNRLIAFASVIPHEDDAPHKLEHYVKEYGCKGLKLHPPIQNFYPSDPRTFPLIHKAVELDIPVLYHTGLIFLPTARLRLSDPLEIDDLAMAIPQAKIVMAHGDPLGYHPVIAGKHSNVSMDLSITFPRLAKMMPGLGANLLEYMSIFTPYAADKLLFGSDASPDKPGLQKDALAAVQAIETDQVTKAKILGGNAVQLLKLSP